MLMVRLFGVTEVAMDETGTTTRDFGGVKPRQILEILALASGTPVTKHRLAELLWNGEPPTSYIGTLESYICVLRRKLGLVAGRACALRTTTQGYLLDPSAVAIDLVEVRRLIRRAAQVAAPEARLRLAEQVEQSVRGALLGGEDAHWATEERDVFAREMAGSCTHAAADAMVLEDFDAAVRLARLAARYDPFAEVAWQHLMRALWATGRRCEALRAYFALRSAMLADLAVEPGPATRALYMQILCDETVPETSTGTHIGPEAEGLVALLRQVLETITGTEIAREEGALVRAAASVLLTA